MAKQKVEYNFHIIICDFLLTRGHNVMMSDMFSRGLNGGWQRGLCVYCHVTGYNKPLL
jgi:hypothetical protein